MLSFSLLASFEHFAISSAFDHLWFAVLVKSAYLLRALFLPRAFERALFVQFLREYGCCVVAWFSAHSLCLSPVCQSFVINHKLFSMWDVVVLESLVISSADLCCCFSLSLSHARSFLHAFAMAVHFGIRQDSTRSKFNGISENNRDRVKCLLNRALKTILFCFTMPLNLFCTHLFFLYWKKIRNIIELFGFVAGPIQLDAISEIPYLSFHVSLPVSLPLSPSMFSVFLHLLAIIIGIFADLSLELCLLCRWFLIAMENQIQCICCCI